MRYLTVSLWYQFDSEFVNALKDGIWPQVSANMDDIYTISNRELFSLDNKKCTGGCHPTHRSLFSEFH